MLPLLHSCSAERPRAGLAQPCGGLRRASSAIMSVVGAIVASLSCASGTLNAEPVLDRILSDSKLLSQKGCDVLIVSFNVRMSYVSHFPLGQGSELRITIKPIDRAQAAAEILSRRETLRVSSGKLSEIKEVEFEAIGATGPTLSIQFAHAVHFDVAQGADFQSLVIAISGKTRSKGCSAKAHAGSLTGWGAAVSGEGPTAKITRSPIGDRPAGIASEAQERAAAAAMDEGRAALKRNKLDEAIARFTKILKLPENRESARAQELLALALERTGNLALARAEYEDYLVRYGDSEGADRVRQRLAALETARGEGQPKLRSTGREDGPKSRPETWSVSGTASQFYIRDDSFRTLRDPSLPPEINGELDERRVHRNVVLSAIDWIAVWVENDVKAKLRFSGAEEHSFTGDEDEISIATLMLDLEHRGWGTDLRLGRQTRNTGGVLGRFDGALASYQATDFMRFNAVVGSPVLRRSDEPFLDEKLFYGASVDLGPFWSGLDVSLFAIEQRDRSVLDRQAIGAEARYLDAGKSLFALVDYDVHFSEFNAATLTGSWTFIDKSVLHAGLDYRKTPYLSTWTALQGQRYLTLYDMLRYHTLDEVERFALDRTALYRAASIGYSRPLSERFQISLDATITNIEGTVASGGVDATPSTGDEYFYSAQLIGNNVTTEGDLFIAGARFADLADTDHYILDLSARYPLIDGLKVSPRLRLSYITGDDSDLEEYSILPSVLLNYYLTRDFALELEVGADWRTRTENMVTETETELFFTIGYRYDFYADKERLCSTPAPAANCH